MSFPTIGECAVDAADCLMKWCSVNGRMNWLVSDGGPAFVGSVLKHLGGLVQWQHHIRVPHAPWATGTIKRTNRSLLEVYKKLQSEYKIESTYWISLCPIIYNVLNHTRLKRLQGMSPIEFETGRKQHSPVSMVLWHGPTLKNSIATKMDYKKLERHTASARMAVT